MNRISPSLSFRTLLPEWSAQDAILLAWPHEDTDWAPILDEVQDTYRVIIEQITRRQPVVLLIPTTPEYHVSLPDRLLERCIVLPCPTNDTWCRDFGPLSLQNELGEKYMVDFTFNAWGMKFAANEDNLVVRRLFAHKLFATDVQRLDALDWVLEGGAIDSNGEGVLLSTDSCLLEANRNAHATPREIYQMLEDLLGAHEVCSLRHTCLPGDDTDGHIDTLVRFVSHDTLVYVAPTNPSSQTYEGLLQMEYELRQKALGRDLRLIPLPDVGNFVSMHEEGKYLPATYANFLFINGAVLFPIYLRDTDAEAIRIMQMAVPHLEVIPIDCSSLVEQHGSLHCISMQIPLGYLHPDLITTWKEKYT